jgi:hypothetical protein
MNYRQAGHKLREQGYNVRIASGCIDLFAPRYYLLSEKEAVELVELTEQLGQTVRVEDYALRRSGSDQTWFNFKKDLPPSMIDDLLSNPLQIPDFEPYTREEAHERD